jgi:molybdenum cofactor cytidylyltransferase
VTRRGNRSALSTPQRPVVGVLLAAGSGSRFGGDKLLATLDDGRPLALAALDALAAGVDAVIAVVRPGDAALHSLFGRSGALVAVCSDAAEGMGASLACGVREVQQRFPQAQGAIIALADMPWLSSATVHRIANALRQGAAMVAPTHRGMRGHPVGFGESRFAELQALSGDEGARRMLSARGAELELIAVDDPGVLRDVDTPADL